MSDQQLTPGDVENLRLLTRGLLMACKAEELSYDEALLLLDEAIARWREGGHLCVSGELAFPAWFTFWQERGAMTPERVRAQHRAPGVESPTLIEVLPGRGERTTQPTPEPTVERRPVTAAPSPSARVRGRFKSYRLGRKLIYVESVAERKHWTTELHWEDYLRLRKSVPEVVVIVDQAHELVQAMVDQGVLA